MPAPVPGLAALSPLQTLLHARPSRALRGVILAVAALVGAAVAWAGTTTVLQVVPGVARVRPAGGPVRDFLDDRGLAAVAPHGGRLAAIAVRDGQRVAPGDELFRLDTEALDERLARAGSELRALDEELAALDRTEQLTRALRDAADARLASELALAGRDRAQRRVERTTAVELARLALAQAAREETLLEGTVAAGATAAADLARARTARAEAEQQLRRVHGLRATDRRDVLARQRAEAALQVDLELAQLEARRIGLARERRGRELDRGAAQQERDRAVVRAEVAGVVAIVGAAAPGAIVPAGQPVVTLTPDAGLRIDAAIPSREIERVRPGMRARVVLDGRDLGARHVVRGVVRYVAPDSEALPLAGGGRAHVYLVSIEVDDAGAAGLRAGMTGRAEIELTRSSLLALAFARIEHTLALE